MHFAAQRAAFPGGRADYYAFFYPPPFLLLCLPLAVLPYLGALFLWLVAGLAALLAALRRILPVRWALLPILADPALVVNAGHGQNGCITAACFGGGFALMERRPILAGIVLGGLVIKPHLAIALPVGLIAARRWAVVAGALLSSVGLCLASWLILGGAAWQAFFAGGFLARETMENGLVDPAKLQSAFAAVKLLGGGTALAYALQATVTLAACLLLAGTASRRPGALAEGAMIVGACLLCTPFLLDYDLVCLAVPLAVLTAEALRTLWRPWEKMLLLAAYILPLVSRPLAMSAKIPLGPFVIAALFAVLVCRWARDGQPDSPDRWWRDDT